MAPPHTPVPDHASCEEDTLPRTSVCLSMTRHTSQWVHEPGRPSGLSLQIYTLLQHASDAREVYTLAEYSPDTGHRILVSSFATWK
jgi:hypothetical protein